MTDRKKRYGEIFRDLFNYLSEYTDPGHDMSAENEEYWDHAGDDLHAITVKWKYDELARSMIIAVYSELQRVARDYDRAKGVSEEAD